MPLVSNFEKLAEEKGLQKGRQETIDVLIRQLKRKIGNFSSELEIKIRNLSIDKLEYFGECLLDFTSLNDLISWLENN